MGAEPGNKVRAEGGSEGILVGNVFIAACISQRRSRACCQTVAEHSFGKRGSDDCLKARPRVRGCIWGSRQRTLGGKTNY